HVSASARLRDSLIATGFPFRVRHLLPSYLRMFHEFINAARDIRRLGAAALDLAYVAAGRFDGFWEYSLSPWDFAVDENFWETGNILASNGKLHPLMREMILATDRK
ncbi:MAG: inositol monophosphatase family protein, partial [bacterium]